MAAILHQLDQRRLIDTNGIADGASIYFYTTGTLTAAAVYTTSALNVEHTSPIVVAAGAAVPDIWLDSTVTYRRRIVYPDGSVDDTDPYTSGVLQATDLASTATGKGATLVGYIDTGASAVARTQKDKTQELGRSATDFASAAARTSFAAFDGSESAQTAIDNASDAIHGTSGSLTLPYAKYPVTQVLVPYDNSTDTRGEPFHLTGAGTGEPFVVSDSLRRGTVIVGGDATVSALKTRPKSGETAQGAGDLQFRDFRVEHTGNSGVAAIDFSTLYGPCIVSRVDVYQQGAGDGIHVGYMATGKIEMGYILGAAWDDGVGAAGTGFKLDAAASAGLQTVSKITSRGFATGFQIGATDGNSVLAASLTDCEVSFCTNGVVLSNACKSTGVDRLYVEGTTGTAISDAGFASYISNPFAELDFTTGVNMGGQGGVVSGGYFGLKSTGATGVKIAAAGSLYGATVKGTHFRWAGNDGTNTAVGIAIEATADPIVNLLGNTFDPAGQWLGSGSAKIKDSSYSSRHGGSAQANGSGAFGLLQRESGGYDVIPCLARGALNLHVDSQLLTEAYVDGSGSLLLSNASVQSLTLSVATTIARLKAPNLPDKTGMVYVDNGNLTLTAGGTYLKGFERTIQVPEGCFCSFEYQILPTGSAPALITNFRLADPRFTVAELADLQGDFDQTIIATDGRRSGEGAGAGTGCPVWWDGTDWRTFYDNSVVAA